MHDHAHRLVDDDEVFVLVKDVERDIFGLRFGLDRCRGNEQHSVAFAHLLFGLGAHVFVERDIALKDEVLDAVAAEQGQCAGQKRVDPFASVIRAGYNLPRKFLFIVFGHMSQSDPHITEPEAELTPDAERVIARARRVFGGSMLVLLLGFIAIGGALVYRAMRDDGAPVARYGLEAVALPDGAALVFGLGG